MRADSPISNHTSQLAWPSVGRWPCPPCVRPVWGLGVEGGGPVCSLEQPSEPELWPARVAQSCFPTMPRYSQ